MHQHDLRALQHSHHFRDGPVAGRRNAVLQVSFVTLLTMAVELAVGWWSGSLALLADGAHMGTHALALGAAALAYQLSERASHAHAHFAFGGWKIEVLAAYTSALLLLGTALWLAWEALDALRAPHPVAWNEAMAVAVLGLVVNLVCAGLLSAAGPGGHAHAHGHAHRHAEGQGHGAAQDHNYRAAYLHVVADALTSLLAIAALAAGAWWSVRWLDPAVALLGALIIGRWALGLLAQTSRALVDQTVDPLLAQQIHAAIEIDGDARVADLHVWQVGSQAWCAALSLVADRPLAPEDYRSRLRHLERLRHVTIEVHRCPQAQPPAAMPADDEPAYSPHATTSPGVLTR